jgi:hypothetical protein
MDDWQGIETAPRESLSDGYAAKHGKRILVYPVRGMVAGARWFQSKVTPESVGFVSDWQEVCEPTHWMPVPDPPKAD